MVAAELTVLTILIVLVLIAIFIFKKLVTIAINSVIGFFALFFVEFFFLPALEINFWSVIITAVGGIFGFIAVVLMHLLGIAF